ncbi:MAG: N-acetylmuramoyl-L-alanine amidase [Eubacterium sp.]|nr:N-acetylmuramoyl-L-alanine amidase [Eubacterium sp.]
MKRIISIGILMAMLLTVLPVAPVKAETDNQEKDVQEQKVIVIDAGHQTHGMSATEPNGPGSKTRKAKVTGGASGVATHLPEYKLNLQVAKKLRKELEKRGYKVIMVRTKNNVKLSNVDRAKIANKNKADAFIRIHANSANSRSVKGALTIAPQNSNPYLSKSVRKKSQTLSKKVLKAYCKATGAKSRGVMYTNTMTGINWCKVPVTIVEMGFMSNPSEDRKMATASYQKKIVKGIANGIDNYFS